MPSTPAGWPPITITITNNNNGNNSNTTTQTNSQSNPQTNTQSNTQTNTQTQTTSVPVTVSTTVTSAPSLVPPSAPVVAPPRGVFERYEVLRAPSQRWFALGATIGLDDDGAAGVRGLVDLFSRGHFSVGVDASFDPGGEGEEDEHHHRRPADWDDDDEHDRGPGGSVGAYVAFTTRLGPLDLRAQLGFGARFTGEEEHEEEQPLRRRMTSARSITGDDDGEDDDDELEVNVSPRAEASLLVGLPLGHQLGIVAGPVLSANFTEDAEGHRSSFDGEREDEGEGPALKLTLFAGLRYRF